jgi:hypothetical protein
MVVSKQQIQDGFTSITLAGMTALHSLSSKIAEFIYTAVQDFNKAKASSS